MNAAYVRCKHVFDASSGAVEHHGADEEDRRHEVGEGGGDVHNLK